MDAKQVNASFDLVSYVSGIATLKKSGAYWISTRGCPLCKAGDDHFQIRRFPDGDVWIARKCGHTKYRSALDFLMEYHKESFTDALKRAGGEVQPRQVGKPHPVQPPAPVQVLPGATWQKDAWNFVDKAASRLEDESGEQGRRYLLSRGISRGSIFMHLLGFAMIGNRPAIVIPYTDVGNVICAIKYRFIDELAKQDKSKRFSMMAGSKPVLFGLQHVHNSDGTLLFVEGELNAISVLQTNPRGVDVVSAGSEGNGHAAILQTLARHYKKIVIWTDEPDKARTIRERMNRPEARLLKSAVFDGVKFDANELLKRGLLVDFLSHQLSTECQYPVLVESEVIEYMSASLQKQEI